MDTPVTITLVANAGVLVEYNGTSLLVDGMHIEETPPFSRIPDRDLVDMCQGLPPYATLDYLLFTHEHPDHLTPACVLEHLRHRPVKGIFLPDELHGSDKLGLLLEHAQEHGVPHRTLSLEPGETRSYRLTDDLEVMAIGTRHMGPQFQGVRNDCLLITLGKVKLLFTGDADHIPEYYEKGLKNSKPDAVFVNPLFYHHAQGQAILNDILCPRNIVVYHMPEPDKDTMRFARMVERDMARYARPDRPTHLLATAGQTLSFPPL